MKKMKKLCFIAPANNYHIHKWCKYFKARGYEIHIISFIEYEIEGVTVHWINPGVSADQCDFKKIKYLFCYKKVAKMVKELEPDIVNVHYATSYGIVAALAKLDNYFLSVWGSDIYDFPNKSIFHKILLMYSLKAAKCILSTSEAMSRETKKYTSKEIMITPFGVDMSVFHPCKRNRQKSTNDYVIGTVKALSPKYGIDYILRAVSMIRFSNPEIPIKVRIAGKGMYEQEYKKMANSLGIDDIVTWLGFITQEEAATEWANMDLAIVYSTKTSESFGVSAVEAQACETPIIISDIPGLMEATLPGETSKVVPRMDYICLAEEIVNSFYDTDKMHEMAKRGRAYVSSKYELEYCFMKIEKILTNY